MKCHKVVTCEDIQPLPHVENVIYTPVLCTEEQVKAGGGGGGKGTGGS